MNTASKILLTLLAIGCIVGAYFLGQASSDNDIVQENVNNTEEQPAADDQTDMPELPASFESAKGVSIELYNLYEGAAVASPFTLVGEVPGNWSFEASFPVRLLDADGNVLAAEPAQIIGDWMTEELVPFKAELDFDLPETETGTLILEKDNPSGLDKNADSIEINVEFTR